MRANARNCSKSCQSKTAGKRDYRENTDRYRERRKAHYKANAGAIASARSHKWYTVEAPKRDRLCSLFERMSDTQRTRYANYLLTKGHGKLLQDSKVDAWLADYNTLE